MKRSLIVSFVAALILFVWQFLSQAALDLHKMEHQYASNQDTIVSFITSQLKEGKYAMPLPKPGCSMEEAQKFMAESAGRPSIIIDYKIGDGASMPMNMLRGLLTNVLIIFLFISIISKVEKRTFVSVLTASIVVGLIGFLNYSYTNYIWYHAPGMFMDLVDAVVGWGLAGLYLGKALKNA